MKDVEKYSISIMHLANWGWLCGQCVTEVDSISVTICKKVVFWMIHQTVNSAVLQGKDYLPPAMLKSSN